MRYLHSVYGLRLATLPADTPLWVAMDFYAQNRVSTRSITAQSLEQMMKRRIGTSKLNATRITMGVPLRASVVADQEVSKANHALMPTATDIYLASMRR